MGGFDIDPASNDLANETIQAAVYYTWDRTRRGYRKGYHFGSRRRGLFGF